MVLWFTGLSGSGKSSIETNAFCLENLAHTFDGIAAELFRTPIWLNDLTAARTSAGEVAALMAGFDHAGTPPLCQTGIGPSFLPRGQLWEI